MRFSLLSLALLCFLFTGCSNNNSHFSFGEIDEANYYNDYFDISLKLPPDWISSADGEEMFLERKGIFSMKTGNEELEAKFQPHEIDEANLLLIKQYGPDKVVNFNPNFILMADNLNNYPGVKTAEDYIKTQKQQLKDLGGFVFKSEDILKKTVNGITFYGTEGTQDANGFLLQQTFYSTLVNGFAINCILTYDDEKQKTGLLGIMENLLIE